jgi:hypothetical protein
MLQLAVVALSGCLCIDEINPAEQTLTGFIVAELLCAASEAD